jgi:anaerobic selenocysteine-containing dehydrogenase
MCGLTVEIRGREIGAIRGNPEDVFSKGHICPKGVALRELHTDPDRLRTPVRRTKRGFEPVSWEDALSEIAARLRKIRKDHGPDAVAVYVGNPTAHSHRAALGSQLLTMVLGTKNRYDPNSQDSNPRLFACMQVYGDGLSMAVPDIERTDYILMLGANPAASQGSQMAMGDMRGRMKAFRERGGRLVLLDPRRSETARTLATRHHFIRPGGDAAFLLALLHVLFAEKLVDRAGVAKIANGLGELEALASRFSPGRVAGPVGIGAAAIREIARELAGTRRSVVYARVGTCQGEFGPVVSWLAEAVNVVLQRIDAPGGAMFSQPAADVGPLARLLVGNEYGRWRSRVRGLPEFLGALPSAVLSEEIETRGKGQIRGLVVFAGNPVLTTPNGARLARALPGLECLVAIDPYVNETSRHAHFVLPPAHVFQSGNFDLLLLPLAVRNVVKYSPPILPRDPATERDDWEILSDLALRLRVPFGPARRALVRLGRDLPERVLDLLLRFGRYNLSLAKLAKTPQGIDLGPLRPCLEEKVATKDGKIRLAPGVLAADVPRVEAWVNAVREDGLVLIGRRSLRDNNSWMHNLPLLARGPDRAALHMNPEDAERLGVARCERVKVTSRAGSVEARLTVTDDVMPGVVSLPHGFGHKEAAETLRVAGALEGPNANALTDEQRVEPIIGTSILNGVPVRVESLVPGALHASFPGREGHELVVAGRREALHGR